MSSSAQLEQEAERTRAQLTQSLAELRERMTPGQLLDQAVGYAKDSGGDVFVRKLGRQVAENPLPITLIGAGMAWLMLARGGPDAPSRDGVQQARERAGAALDRTTERMSDATAGARDFADSTRDAATGALENAGASLSETASAARDAASNAMENAGQSLSETAAAAGDRARSFYDTARSSTADAFGRASDTAARAGSSAADPIAGIGPRTAAAANDIAAFCREQPLVTAALGLTLGAILGAFVPQTDAEDALMGNARDRLKREAQAAAKEEYEKAKSTAQSAVRSGVEAARTQAQRQELGGTLATEPNEAPLVPAADQGMSDQPAESGEHR
ncbi:MAG TPA: DUF3618 domain-containing protein [Xanthobacteraceae bacterium]|nr:DUF3618 domain-containing protein [Xanthobacteraceae bacterium]